MNISFELAAEREGRLQTILNQPRYLKARFKRVKVLQGIVPDLSRSDALAIAYHDQREELLDKV